MKSMKKENQPERLMNIIKECNHPTKKQNVIFKKENKEHLQKKEELLEI